MQKKSNIPVPLSTQPSETKLPHCSEELCINTVQEAIGVLQYLMARRLLCTRCGYRTGHNENQYNLHCDTCRIPNQLYTDVKKTRWSDFDRVLGKALERYADRVISKQRADS
jgi:hypothetical protein